MNASLEAEGLADNTIVVFTSDHGELSGAHGLLAKQQPYEESVGIPFLVYCRNRSLVPRRSGAWWRRRRSVELSEYPDAPVLFVLRQMFEVIEVLVAS